MTTRIWALHVLTNEGPFLTMHDDKEFEEYTALRGREPVSMAGTMITRGIDGYHYSKCYIIPTDVRQVVDPLVSMLVVEAMLDYVEIEDEDDKPQAGNPFRTEGQEEPLLSVLEDVRLVPLEASQHSDHCLHQN